MAPVVVVRCSAPFVLQCAFWVISPWHATGQVTVCVKTLCLSLILHVELGAKSTERGGDSVSVS